MIKKTIDLLLVTPPSRLEVYQSLSNDFAAIEPPVWSGLIAEFVRRKGFSVQILDAEALGLTHQETASAIIHQSNYSYSSVSKPSCVYFRNSRNLNTY